ALLGAVLDTVAAALAERARRRAARQAGPVLRAVVALLAVADHGVAAVRRELATRTAQLRGPAVGHEVAAVVAGLGRRGHDAVAAERRAAHAAGQAAAGRAVVAAVVAHLVALELAVAAD